MHYSSGCYASYSCLQLMICFLFLLTIHDFPRVTTSTTWSAIVLGKPVFSFMSQTAVVGMFVIPIRKIGVAVVLKLHLTLLKWSPMAVQLVLALRLHRFHDYFYLLRLWPSLLQRLPICSYNEQHCCNSNICQWCASS